MTRTKQTEGDGVNLSYGDKFFIEGRHYIVEKQSKGVASLLTNDGLPTKEAQPKASPMDPRDFAKSIIHPKLVELLIEAPLDKLIKLLIGSPLDKARKGFV